MKLKKQNGFAYEPCQVLDDVSVEGYKMFLRTEEIWRIMQRAQQFHNWFTKLLLGQL